MLEANPPSPSSSPKYRYYVTRTKYKNGTESFAVTNCHEKGKIVSVSDDPHRTEHRALVMNLSDMYEKTQPTSQGIR